MLCSAASCENTIGSTNWAFLPSKSACVTPRATEQAPQTWIGMPAARTFSKSSGSGGKPIPWTVLAISSFIR